MRFDDISAVDFVSSDAAVVRTLRPRESGLGPAKRMSIDVEQRVLLLDAEPRPLLGRHVHQLLAFGSVVRVRGLAAVEGRGGGRQKN